MSKKIKFRAWDKVDKEYRHDINIALTLEGELYVIWAYHPQKITSNIYIIEQYTGLKDKNGKYIYEGDIVEIGKYGKYQVIWNEWACKFDFDKIGKREREEPLLSQDWEQEAEVIGNIHENSELLEGGK